MKKIVCALLLGANIAHSAPKTEAFHATFHSDLISALDGVKGCIDGNNIKGVMGIRKGSTDMLVGAVDKTSGQRVGSYTFKGKKHTVQQLADVEKSLKKKYDATEALIKKKYKGQELAAQLAKAKKEYEHDVAELKSCLAKAREDFKSFAFQFLGSIQGIKPMVLKLMQESCDQRGIKNSAMLRWGETNGSNESAIFSETVDSCQTLARFLSEIREFLGDMIYNCPRGFAQFKQQYIDTH